MEVKRSQWNYIFPFSNLPILVQDFAFNFPQDIQWALRNYSELYPSSTMDAAQNLFNFLQKRYIIEEAEQFLRPQFFAMVGGDCDDQMIFALAFYKFLGVPVEKMFIHEGGKTQERMTHIYCSVYLPEGTAIFDALPNNRFGELTSKFIKTYPVSDFL